MPVIGISSPVGKGWDEQLRPKLCDESPALAEQISCGCLETDCRSSHCKCFKDGQVCTDACSCRQCMNRGENTDESDDTEAETGKKI